jgi:hypothetical protein
MPGSYYHRCPINSDPSPSSLYTRLRLLLLPRMARHQRHWQGWGGGAGRRTVASSACSAGDHAAAAAPSCAHTPRKLAHALMLSSGAVCLRRVCVALCTSCIHCRVHTLCVCGTCAPFAATKCFYVLTLCVQRPPRAGAVASWPVCPYQVKLMSLVPLLVAAYVAPAAASAATDASRRCWRGMAMGDTPTLMKELIEVVFAVRCAGGSGPSSCILHNRRRLTCRIHSRRRLHPRGVRRPAPALCTPQSKRGCCRSCSTLREHVCHVAQHKAVQSLCCACSHHA